MLKSKKKVVAKPKQAAGLVAFSSLTADPRNANKGTKRGAALIKKSLKEYGAGRSILLDKNNRVIAGNKTLAQAGNTGIKGVRIIETDGTEIIAVKRTDLDLQKDGKAKSLAIADNRAGELSLDWDPDVLKALDIDLGGFFNDDELAAILGTSKDLLTDEDDVPDPPKKPKAKRGDIFTLGDHRLMCGDSTSAEDVAKLLGEAKPLLMVTDPPYGVSYDPTWRAEAGVNKNREKMGKVQNDLRADWREAWMLFPGRIAYVWHAGRHASTVQASLEACDFAIRNQVIWAKDRFALSRGDYHWQHEPCWYAVKGKGNWVGNRSQSTLWQIPSREDGGHGHGTQKPVECMRRPILNNSRSGDAVYDPFCGSGTTLIACETEGRSCLAMEIDPIYVDTIIARWEAATGQKAKKVAGA